MLYTKANYCAHAFEPIAIVVVATILFPDVCEVCHPILSTNITSINNVITVLEGNVVSFTCYNRQLGHDGFTLEIDKLIKNPNFTCESERNGDATSNMLIYYCVAVQSGVYNVNAFVTFCNKEYYSHQNFSVVVKQRIQNVSSKTSLVTISTYIHMYVMLLQSIANFHH